MNGYGSNNTGGGRPVPRRWRGRVLLFILLIIFFLMLAALFTRPAIVKGNHATIDNTADPTMTVWTLSWDLRVLARNPLNFFNANILYPNPHTLAYSDHQLVNAILAAPLVAITNNPVYSANLLVIFNFFLCALGAYLLVAHLTKNRIAGVVAGIAFAYAPNRLAHVTHLNLTSAGWMPLTLLFLHMYSEEGRPRDAFLALLFFTVQTLTTWHYGVILSITLLLFLVVRLIARRRTFTLKWILTLGVAAVVASAIILPFLMPYLQLQSANPRLKRTIGDVDVFSSDVQDFIVAPKENLLWGTITRPLLGNINKRGGGERAIFPGLIALILGACGVYYLFRRGKGEERFSLYYYLSMLVVAAVLCLGTSLYLFGHRFNLPMPYRLFYYLYPGFKGMRVPPRFSILISLSLAVLAGFGVKWIITRITAKRGVKIAAAAAAVIILLLIVDLLSVYLPMAHVPLRNEFPPVYKWLEARPGESPTVEMPLASYNPKTFNSDLQWEPTWLLLEPARTYFSTLHWKKILNGFTSFVPSTYYDAVYASRDFPSAEAFAFFRKMKLQYMIVHGGEYDPAILQRIKRWDTNHTDFNLVKRFGSDYVYTLGAK